MNDLRLSTRAGIARPSPTLAITARANAMKAANEDVISFGAGEPDFNTPEEICAVGIAAIKEGFTKYTASSGIPALREAIAQKLERENGIAVEPAQVVASCGAKHSLYNAMQVLISPGDEVILLAPYWMTYSDQVSLAGGIPVVVDCLAENQFVPTREALESKITPRTRAIMVNSPCNPTGAVYPLEALQVIAELARANNLWLVCDEIYEKLVYGVKHYSIAAFEGMADQTITIGGCSKTFSMTGWRLGFAAAPLAVAKAMSNFQDQVTSNPTSFVQKAAIAAFGMAPAKVEVMRAEFEARRNVMKDELMKLPGIEVPSPKGAFYFFVDVRQFLGGDFPDDMALAETILERAKVATVPGSVFGAPGFIRLSYTADQNNIRRGVARIGDLLNSSGV